MIDRNILLRDILDKLPTAYIQREPIGHHRAAALQVQASPELIAEMRAERDRGHITYIEACDNQSPQVAAMLDLLARYIDHVGQCTGEVFMAECNEERYTIRSTVQFSAEDVSLLTAAARMAWNQNFSTPYDGPYNCDGCGVPVMEGFHQAVPNCESCQRKIVHQRKWGK